MEVSRIKIYCKIKFCLLKVCSYLDILLWQIEHSITNPCLSKTNCNTVVAPRVEVPGDKIKTQKFGI